VFPQDTSGGPCEAIFEIGPRLDGLVVAVGIHGFSEPQLGLSMGDTAQQWQGRMGGVEISLELSGQCGDAQLRERGPVRVEQRRHGTLVSLEPIEFERRL
jgi:hypothetical protein